MLCCLCMDSRDSAAFGNYREYRSCWEAVLYEWQESRGRVWGMVSGKGRA